MDYLNMSWSRVRWLLYISLGQIFFSPEYVCIIILYLRREKGVQRNPYNTDHSLIGL